jgi:RNA polymerase sigma factor (sigma-70 family)
MRPNRVEALAEQLRKAALQDGGTAPSDGELLECYLALGEPVAFDALVRRHMAMVLGVCRRVLGNEQDAEDAVQATFLVLARQGRSIRQRRQVGSWLYGVAYRTALRARQCRARRWARERPLGEDAKLATAPAPEANELLGLLEQALNRLPDKYRSAVVLCELKGLSRQAAAAELGIPPGTLSSRLAKAHGLLARRMARHAPAGSPAIATLLAQTAWAAAVPPSLLTAASTIHSTPAARVLTLAESVMRTMLLTKFKNVALGCLLALVPLLTGPLLVVPASGTRLDLAPGRAEQKPADGNKAKNRQARDTPPAGEEAAIQAILARAVKALGGDKGAKNLQAFTWKTRMEVKGEVLGSVTTVEYSVAYPSRMRMVVQQKNRTGTVLDYERVIDGDRGWDVIDGKRHDFPKGELQRIKERLYADWVAKVYPLQGQGFQLSLLGDRTIRGKPAVGIRVTSAGHEDIYLYFDKKSGLPLKRQWGFKGWLYGEAMVKEEVYYEDYREVTGVKYPGKLLTFENGRRTTEFETVSYTPAAGPDAKLVPSPNGKDGVQPKKGAQTAPPLPKELHDWLEEAIGQARARARPTLPAVANTLEQARELALAEKDVKHGMGEWAAEYKGWFVFAHGTAASPLRGFRGIAVKKGTKEMGRFGSW